MAEHDPRMISPRTFRCPGCHVKLKAKPDQVGKRFRCPKCKTSRRR